MTSLAEFKQVAIANTLRSCQLFVGLPMPDLHRVAEIAMVKSLEKGEFLFRERETSRGFYIVQRGAINLHRVNSRSSHFELRQREFAGGG